MCVRRKGKLFRLSANEVKLVEIVEQDKVEDEPEEIIIDTANMADRSEMEY